MPAFHALDKTADAEFLRAGVADPLTRVAFRPTNHVARCATCGMVSLRETWEAVGGCPNGHTAVAPWDPRAALTAPGFGDGASAPVAPPLPAPARPARPAWLWPALAGVLALAAVGLWQAGVFERDEAPDEVSEAGPIAPTGPEAEAVEAGETVGRLGESDFRGSDGRYQDLLTFAADSSGRVLSVTLVSSDFAPELSVETPTGERVRADLLPPVLADDGTPSPERRVVVRDLRGPGLYRLLVTSRDPNASGGYTLRVRFEDAARTLTPGAAALQGELSRTSPQVGGFYRDTYRFTAAAGREHTIRVGSSAFAPVVTVTGPGNTAVRGETGRAGGSVTYTFTPASGGAHTVVVSTREAGRTGPYTVGLTVEAAPRAPEIRTPSVPTGPSLPPDGSATRDSLGVGQSRSYGLNGRVGDRVTIEVRTDGFAPTLVLVAPDGTRTPATSDGDRARLRATLPTGGRYRVELSGSGAGFYSVTLDQQAAPTSDRIPRLPGQEPIQSEITPNDPPPGGTYQPQPITPQP